jgi:hypothetical protein
MSEPITYFLEAVEIERQRQIRQGKAEDNPHALWYLVVADQLALVTRELSLARYRGVATSSDEIRLSPTERAAIMLGLVRLGACAAAWWEALDREIEK